MNGLRLTRRGAWAGVIALVLVMGASEALASWLSGVPT